MVGEQQRHERRSHQKSRRGCFQCKAQHVKCDESKPTCARCVRLGVRCGWPVEKNNDRDSQTRTVRGGGTLGASSPSLHSHISALPSSSSSSRSPPGTSPAQAPKLAVNDLKLLHYWMVNTSLTCASVEQHHLWQSALIELGFNHHFLLRGILAVTAIHKATVHTGERIELLAQASMHMDAAVKSFSNHIRHPDPATCCPVFALATLLVVYHMGVAEVQRPVNPVVDLCACFHLIKGVELTIGQHWDRLLTSEVAPLLRSVHRRGRETTSTRELDDLRILVNGTTNTTPATRTAYLDAISELDIVFTNVRGNGNGNGNPQSFVGIALSWAATLPDCLLDLLRDRDPVALIILTHFAVLLSSAHHLWWTRNWAKWILDSARESLAPQYRGWIRWPEIEIERESGF